MMQLLSHLPLTSLIRAKWSKPFREEFVVKTHGKSHIREYYIWKSMWQRCTLSTNPGYKSYGGRGIKVCDRWKRFEDFYADMFIAPKGHQLDRIDNNGNYCKENCRWTTAKNNCRNRRNNRVFVFEGEKKCLSELSEEYGISAATISDRLKKGFSVEYAVKQKVIKNGERKTCRFITFLGQTKILADWSRDTGINYSSLKFRLSNGWSVEEALTTSVKHSKKKE